MERKVFGLKVASLKEREFEGYGAVFGNVDYGGDVIAQGAFKKSLAEHKKAGSLPVMLWSHNPSIVIGKWHEMSEDENGLRVRGELADTQAGRETHTLLKMDAVGGMSIGYETLDSDYRKDGVRVLKEIRLHELSVVAMPMNPLAQITGVKLRLSANGEYVPTARELEQKFRDMGCSKSVARHLVAKIFDTEAGVMPADDEESGGTPEASGGMPQESNGDAERAAKALADKLLMACIKLPKFG
jgi:HK97 family phage prohead protease